MADDALSRARRYVLALDQGTTSSRAILFTREGRPLAQRNVEFRQIYPRPAWVEHDPNEIWESQISAVRQLLEQTGVGPSDIAAVGITNQRETTILWDRTTGAPVYNAIVWQCRRTTDLCQRLKASGWEEKVRHKTGLVLDPYFSATKVKWILDNVPGVLDRAARGDVLFGTVDTWLMWKLSGGRIHATDYSNASRTMLFNIHARAWDEDILRELGIPRAILPEVKPSSHVYGYTDPSVFGQSIPISGVAGDQQAALFGQACFDTGDVKNTYGTGAFIMMNTGRHAVRSDKGMLTTIAWGIGDDVEYALEGSIFIAGAAVQWLRDELKLIASAQETEAIARSIPDNGGVFLVPAFVGLGAPWWDPDARGTIVGLTRGTGRAHIVRAALEAIAYQTRDVLDQMCLESGLRPRALRVDGGAVSNDFLMQFQADVLGIPVLRPVVSETTALGAAYLAGLAVGFWRSRDELREKWALQRRFDPVMGAEERERLYERWRSAVQRALKWETTISG